MDRDIQAPLFENSIIWVCYLGRQRTFGPKFSRLWPSNFANVKTFQEIHVFLVTWIERRDSGNWA
jgi:hypothetical protein